MSVDSPGAERFRQAVLEQAQECIADASRRLVRCGCMPQACLDRVARLHGEVVARHVARAVDDAVRDIDEGIRRGSPRACRRAPAEPELSRPRPSEATPLTPGAEGEVTLAFAAGVAGKLLARLVLARDTVWCSAGEDRASLFRLHLEMEALGLWMDTACAPGRCGADATTDRHAHASHRPAA